MCTQKFNLARIFFITPRFPWPLTKGDQLRAYNQIKYLSRENEITLFAISEERIKPEWVAELRPYCKQIEIFQVGAADKMLSAFRLTGHLPFQSVYHYHPRALKRLKAIYGKLKPQTMIFQLLRTAPYAEFFPKEICIIDLMDCFSYHYLLRGKFSGLFKSLFYKLEHIRLKKYEAYLISRYSRICVISLKDKKLLPGNTDHITVVANGVDFRPLIKSHKTQDLLFLGNLKYQPNVAAAEFITNEILPELLPDFPHIKITIAGYEPSQKVLEMGNNNVQILADVKDTQILFRSSKIFVAPMFLSTGIQNKILEAMAAGLLVITTPNAADAIGAIPGVHLLTAVSAKDFAEKIRNVLSVPAFYEDISDNTFSLLEKNYNWQKNIEILQGLIDKI